MSKEAYYFKHFCNARNDRKIRKARLQLGIEAYALYFMLLEVLREEKDFKYPISDLDVLASEFDTSIQKLDVLIRSYGLFIIDQESMFFSVAQLEGLKSWMEQKEINRLKGIQSGIARRNKIKNQIETLSQGDSNEPRFNSSSTAVELREEKRREEKKNIINNSDKKNESFLTFRKRIKKEYLNKIIINDCIKIENQFNFMLNVELSVSKTGYLYDMTTTNDLRSENATLIWQWLYNHQIYLNEVKG